MSVDRYWERKTVLLKLQKNLDWKLFESSFFPDDNSCIWKIFLLHIAIPSQIPIYDQHVYRAFEFIHTGKVREIPSKDKDKYAHFKNHYYPWFQQIRKDYKFEVKFIDDACFAFGKTVKILNRKHQQALV